MTRFRLPLIHSETLLSDGGRRTHTRVFCPRASRIIDADGCPECPHVRHVSGVEVVCAPPVPALPGGGESPVGSSSSLVIADAEEDVLMKRIFPLDFAPTVVPVIDDGGRFIGFVHTPDTGGSSLPPRLIRALPAGAVIFGKSLWIRDGTPLRAALHAMAARRSRILAIVDDQARLRGLLHDVVGLRALHAGDAGDCKLQIPGP